MTKALSLVRSLGELAYPDFLTLSAHLAFGCADMAVNTAEAFVTDCFPGGLIEGSYSHLKAPVSPVRCLLIPQRLGRPLVRARRPPNSHDTPPETIQKGGP